MRPILRHLFMAGLFLFALQVSGQPLTTTFAPATVNATLGGTVSLQLKVTNFTNITSLQFPITYNSAVLQFTSINNATLPGFSAANYNATTGKVTVSWYPDLGLYPNGYSTADNSAIFTVNFNVLANGSTTVNLASTAPGIEVTRNNNVIVVNFGAGGSSVTAGSGGPGPLMGFHVLANTINIPQGQTACMPMTVHDFDNIVSASYAMHWNTSVLQYQNTQAYNLPDLLASNFNPYSPGTLLMSWYDQTLNGVTKADGASIYEVCFKATGAVGSSSMITIDGVGFPPSGGGAEVINASSQNVWTASAGIADTIFVVTAPPPANAVTFTADKDTVPQGQITCVDVRVKNFTDIISMQLGMTYDVTKIQFQSFQFGANPLNLSAANFNPNVPGEIKFTWFDPNAQGVDLNDSTVIFSVCFTAVGPIGTTSPFTFTPLPGFAVEIVKEPAGEVIPQLNNGLVHISSMPTPMVKVDSVQNVACNGAANGAIFISTSGGTPATYTWSGPGVPGSPDPGDLMGVIATTYTVTVTFAGGATATTSTAVVAPPALSMSQVVPTGVTCFGGANGSISLNMQGGTPPYTFAWGSSVPPPPANTSGATGTTVNGLKAGTYTTTVTDTRGCTTASSAISVSTPTDFSLVGAPQVTNIACFGNTNGAINISVTGGNGGTTVMWSGPGGFTANTEDLTGLSMGGQYTPKVTDNKGCSKTLGAIMVTAPTAALQVSQTGAITDATCFGANNGKACVTVTGGTTPPAPTISWKIGNQTIANGPCPSTLQPGSYSVSVTDVNGCTTSVSPIIVGGPTTPIEIAQTVEHVQCFGDNDGCITLVPTGGSGAPFSVQWTNNNATTMQICNLAGGTYTPTIKDKNDCPYTFDPIPVNEPQALTTSNVQSTPQNGATPNGSISLTVNGGTSPYTFAWTGPNGYTSTAQNLTGLSYGTYNLTITDAHGCTQTLTQEVENTNLLLITQHSSTPACNQDGCINLDIPAGAAAPFIVTWAGGAQSQVSNEHTFSICNLKSGNYSMTITDAANNVHTILETVTQKEQAIVGDSRTNPFDDTQNGSITLTPIPVGTFLEFKWNTSPSDTTASLINLDSGTYVVTVTNPISGCSTVYTYKLVRTYQKLEVKTTQVTPANCLNTANGAIVLEVKGGNQPYEYTWEGPGSFTANTKDISGLYPGTYTCTVTDENDTLKIQTIQVISTSGLVVTNVNELSNYGGFQVSSTAVCDGNATVVYGGNAGAVSIQWSNGGTDATNNALCGGPYSVTVTDNLGCSSVWSDSLSVPASVVAVFQVASALLCSGECDAIANLQVVGGIPPYTIKWPSGQTDQITQPNQVAQAKQLCGGDYKVTITDAFSATNGATYTVTGTVIEPEELVIEFSGTPPFSFTSCDGVVGASTPAAAGQAYYTWSSAYGLSGDTLYAENLCAGDVLSFVVEDDNGCLGQGTYKVPYPADGCLQVRPVLTPGQADKNDYTLITCIEDYPENTFEVYNRWGQLVFQTTAYSNLDSGRRWEGLTSNGSILPDGVYFFVLKFVDDDGHDQQVKGYINLLR